MKIFGRDPSAWLALVAVIVEMLVAWGLPLSEQQQAGINAVATALFGLLLAALVARDKVIPVAAGLVVAVGQAAIAFGAHLSQHEIAVTGALVTTVLALWLRTQVTAPVAPDGSHVAQVSLADTRGA